ncbi:GntR family transcriptional regulator/MocR family aminotransferase [Chitinophaga skermanii]|uniref:GntR family transcriptional regulator/MocR family aminotransferase n=1 Tax=Chitinophaga skermanii TaxID=331697 RepID=A0A327QX69_9BACT|nr:PLP-dependent aminotransferase family protein [Chitinophaga skermanii]RAJ08222.1 GntR family transcriptional regulator/MocR family aminotransferase [Chitinophaga skermanii]
MLRPWSVNIQLDESAEKAIYLQIADAIIHDIKMGRLKAGEALPGSRLLAQLLKVNRNTVVDALQVLLMEGWLVSKERKGTFVAETTPTLQLQKDLPVTTSTAAVAIQKAHTIVFDDGHPDSKIAPINELARAYRQIFSRKARWKVMDYACELGSMEFRKAIAQMLNHQRGMQINESQVCITRGSQMATYLAAQCLLEKGDAVMIETPGYKPAWAAFEKAGAELLPVRVDGDGLVIDDILHHLQSKKRIKAIFTTPHRQYPTTVTLSLQRRYQLVELSNKYGFTIIEDDYDNEFHFGYRPFMPISSLPGLANFIYIGTMSKVVAPALRTGYLVSSRASFIESIGELRKIIDVQGDIIMEQAVLQLIHDGTIKRHIKKATLHYKAKRDKMSELLGEHLATYFNYTVPEGGLAFWLTPKENLDTTSFFHQLSQKNISLPPSSQFYFGKNQYGIRLGYGSLSEDTIAEGVKLIASVL